MQALRREVQIKLRLFWGHIQGDSRLASWCASCNETTKKKKR